MASNTLADLESGELGDPWAPDFLGIGAQASGTTWLWENLQRHPSVWLPSTKELHFFDHHIERRVRVFRWLGVPPHWELKVRYGSRFAPGNLQGRITGEITPAYSVLPVTKVRVIRKLLPKVRILVLLRDPVDRAWSHAKKSFPPLYNKPLEDAEMEELLEFFDLPFVRNRGDYAGILETWFSVFDRDQFFVRTMQEATGNPRTYLRNLFEHLNLETDPGIDWNAVEEPVNKREADDPPKEIISHLRTRYKKQGQKIEELTGRTVQW